MAWEDVHVEVLQEFVQARMWAPDDALFMEQLAAKRRLADVMRSRDYYRFVIKCNPKREAANRERKRQAMRRKRAAAKLPRSAYAFKQLDLPWSDEMRERMPGERKGVIWHFTIHTRDATEVDGYLTTGLYADGRVGEIFVKMGKTGDHSGWINAWSKAFSMLLQLGVPLEVLCNKFKGEHFDPAGATECKDVPRCTSVTDLVSRYLLFKYGKKEAVQP